MRAAVLTTSPAAIPSPAVGRAPRLISASPVLTPIRTWMLLSSRAQSRIAGAAGLLARAADPLVLGAQAEVVRRQHGANALRVEPLRLCREPDEVGEEN